MPRNFAGTSQFMRGTGNPFSGNGPGALLIWRRLTSINQQASQYLTLDDGTSTNRTVVGSDITGSTSGKTAAVQANSTTNSQALADTAQTANTWQLDVGAFGTYPNSQIVYLAGAHKNSKAAIINPATTTTVQIGGRGTQDLAHAAILTRLPSDLEIAACGIGLVNPQALGLANYYYVNQTVTENDLVGSINLTVTGTSSVSGDPNIATWYTGSAIPNQSWTQGAAITSIDLTAKFDNGVAATAPWTGTLKQLGSAGTSTNANGAGTASTQITTAAALTVGQWAKVGSQAATPVLYVSGNTALLQTAQTWADGDTVIPFPVQAVAAITGNGVTVNGSNLLTGTPGAGAVGTYNNCLLQATNTANTGAISYSNLFNVAIASSGSAPSFSAGPTLQNATTDGYAFTATSNQTATWYTCVLLKGSSAPTATQVRTGSPTGFVSRFSVAVTLNIAAAQTVTALTFPLHDVYHVLNNGSGDSAVVANLALFKLPPTGKQYVTATLVSISAITKANPAALTTSGSHGRTSGDWVEVFGVAGMVEINGAWTQCTVVDGTHLTLNGIDSTAYTTYTSGGNLTWGRSSFASASPAVVTGDVLMADLTDGQGAPLTFTAEGVALFSTNSILRQSFAKDVYDVSAGNFMGAANDYENDAPPLFTGTTGGLPFLYFPLNQATSVNIAALFPDPQGDTPTISALTSLPANRTLTTGTLSGTPNSNALTLVSFQAQNASGETTQATITILDGGIAVPNAVGLNQSDADDVAQANFFNDQFGTQDDPNPQGPAAAGTVIAQSPAAGSIAAPGQTLLFTLSSGNSSILPTVPTLTTAITKSPQILMEEGLNAILSYGVFKPFGKVRTGPQDLPGTKYRFFRIPATAIVTTLQFMNDPNPTGSAYKLGFLLPNNGGLIVPGSDAVLLPTLTLDTPRLFWTDLFTPATVGGPALVENVGKRVWELLGLPTNPNLNPALNSQDIFYDVVMTCTTPGTTGGYVAVRMEYSRGPDRGLIAAAGVQYG